MYNILFITSILSNAGGEQRSITLLCNELVGRNIFNITIACLNETGTWFPLDSRIKTVFLDKAVSGEKKLSRLKRFVDLIDLIRNSSFDLIIGYGRSTRISVGLIQWMLRIPIIFCERIDPAYKNPFFEERIKDIIGIHLMCLKNVICQSNAAMKYYRKAINKAVIPNMIDIQKLHDVNIWINRSLKVINTARCVHQKNQMMLVRAFALAHESYPQYTMEIYGEGNLELELDVLIKQLKAESYITLHPSTQDVFGVMNGSKIFVCSSDYEGYPNALLEAMAMGMACISTDCSGSITDMIENGVNGLVVPVNDAQSMSEALKKLMSDDILAEEIASRAVAIKEKNAKEKIIGDWIAFFLTIIEVSARSKAAI